MLDCGIIYGSSHNPLTFEQFLASKNIRVLEHSSNAPEDSLFNIGRGTSENSGVPAQPHGKR